MSESLVRPSCWVISSGKRVSVWHRSNDWEVLTLHPGRSAGRLSKQSQKSQDYTHLCHTLMILICVSSTFIFESPRQNFSGPRTKPSCVSGQGLILDGVSYRSHTDLESKLSNLWRVWARHLILQIRFFRLVLLAFTQSFTLTGTPRRRGGRIVALRRI